MLDNYGRNIDYARISLTQKCNFSCLYCQAEGCGENALSRWELVLFINALHECGINKIKLTGGEPLLREDIIDIIRDIKSIADISVTLTTNGYFLKKYAGALRDAGLSSVNISLDSVNRENFCKITGADALQTVLDGIAAAYETGLNTKINTVVLKNVNDNEVIDIASLARDTKIDVRFIEHMPMVKTDFLVSGQEVKNKLDAMFGKSEYLGNLGAGPAVCYHYKGFLGDIGFINAVTGKFCSGCSRIRLTSQGILKPCLCYDEGINLRGKKGAELKALIEKAILQKPEGHDFGENKKAHGKGLWQFGG